MSESESAVKREQSAVSEREKKDACIEGVSKVAEPRLMTLDDGAEIRILVSVSYTHLTLPTILLV